MQRPSSICGTESFHEHFLPPFITLALSHYVCLRQDHQKGGQ